MIEKRPLDIEAMILEENDPKQRAFLIVLNSINLNLNANTAMTKQVAERLDGHLAEFTTHANREESIINKGIGAWKVMGWVLGVAQTLLFLGIGYLSSDLKDIHAALVESVAADNRINIRLDRLEARK